MSTILEALRRAEAERAQPGAAQALPPVQPLVVAAAPSRKPWLLPGLILLILVAGASLVFKWPAAQPEAKPEPVQPPPATISAATPSPTPPVLLEAPGARVLPAPSPTPALVPASAPTGVLTEVPRTARTQASAAAPAAPAKTAERVPRLAELPAALRQQMPPLRLGGSMFSPDARVRSLIVNGQLYREGDRLAPDLELLEIQPGHALLRFRGQVFELSL